MGQPGCQKLEHSAQKLLATPTSGAKKFCSPVEILKGGHRGSPGDSPEVLLFGLHSADWPI